MGWEDVTGPDGKSLTKAKELGLIENPAMWEDTIIEAFNNIRSFGKRFGWIAALFSKAGIMDAREVLDRVLAHDNKYLHPTSLQNNPAAAKQYVLTRLEYLFRLMNVAHGLDQTCCEALGLEAPDNFDMSNDEILNV